MSNGKSAALEFTKQQWMQMLRVTLILLAVAAAVALMLSAVNEVTAPRIQEQKEQAVITAMQQVLPAEEYAAIENLSQLGLDAMITQVYQAKAGGADAGYCVEVTSSGYGGDIEMVVGVDMEDKVTNVNIVSMSETPGLGSKAQDAAFLDQFQGKMDGLTVKTNGGAGENQVDAVTGATVSSKAVTSGVQAALKAVQQIKGAASNG